MSKEKHDGDPMEGYATGKQVQFNMDWYDKLRASKPSWKFKEKYTVEPNNGHAIYIDKGQVFKFVQVEGPNICDVHFFGADIKDASGEHYETTYSSVFEGLILKKNSRIWSTVPYFRPMATYIDDNIDPALMPDEDYWPLWHGGHCSPEAIELAYGVKNHHACHANFTEVAARVGLDESVAALPNVNVFQPMAMKPSRMPNGNISVNWHAAPFEGPPGTFMEFYAEIDLLILAVHCPYGNQSKHPMDADHYPIDIEIYDTGITPQPSPQWHDWRPAHKAKIERLKKEGGTAPRKRTFD